MNLGAQELGGLFYRPPERGDRNPRPPLTELFNGEAIRKHVDDLGNPDASILDREFTARPLRPSLKVFHSMNMVARRPEKVEYGISLTAVPFSNPTSFYRLFEKMHPDVLRTAFQIAIA
jgi:hypothetical protein